MSVNHAGDRVPRIRSGGIANCPPIFYHVSKFQDPDLLALQCSKCTAWSSCDGDKSNLHQNYTTCQPHNLQHIYFFQKAQGGQFYIFMATARTKKYRSKFTKTRFQVKNSKFHPPTPNFPSPNHCNQACISPCVPQNSSQIYASDHYT